MNNQRFYIRQAVFLLPVLVIIVAFFAPLIALKKYQSIHEAAKNGDLTRVEALVKGRPELVFLKYHDAETPLYTAASAGHADVVKFLISCGADVNTESYDGIRALHMAAMHGHVDVVKLLLARGADVNARGLSGRPLNYAMTGDQKAVAELLLDHGADVNAGDSNGPTPLYDAVEREDRAWVQLLLAHGADANSNYTNHLSPFIEAKSCGDKNIEELLRQHGGRD